MGKSERSKQDDISPEETVNMLLSGKSVDRVPFFSYLSAFPATNVGYEIGDFYTDTNANFWAHVWTQEQYGYSGYPIYWFAAMNAWDFGGQIKWPTENEQAPKVVRYPAISEEDIEKLEMPELKTAGTIPRMMAFSRQQEKHGMRVTWAGGGPSGILALTDAVQIARWIKKRPELVHRLCRLTTDFSLQVAQYWVDSFGAENIMPFFVNAGGFGLLSVKHFEEFLFPYWLEIHEKVLTMGVKNILCHICGDVNLFLPYLAKLPMGDPGIVTCPHQVDLITFIKYFGDKCIIAGNVDPVRITFESPYRVFELCKEAIKKGKDAPRGYMLSAGCEIPPNTPPYNVYVVQKAVRDLGWYD